MLERKIYLGGEEVEPCLSTLTGDLRLTPVLLAEGSARETWKFLADDICR